MRIVGDQTRRVSGYDEGFTGCQGAARRKRVADAVGESPVAQIHAPRAAVVEFDVRIVSVGGDRVKHDFVEDDRRFDSGTVVGSGRGVCQQLPTLAAVLGAPDPKKKGKEIAIKVARRLRKHLHDPRFKELAERLEDLKRKHDQSLLKSVDFLKELLQLAKDVVAVEHSSPPIDQEERGKSALTELFEEARNGESALCI